MAREIELKIPLSENQYNHILNLIQKSEKSELVNFSDFENLYKTDEYYSRYDTREERRANGEPKVIRIRTEKSEDGEKAFFTIKHKSKKDGIEFNDEQETFVENPQVLRNLFAETGFKKWFGKIKEAVSVYISLKRKNALEFHLELEKVNGFLYAEIEYTKDDAAPAAVGAELEEIVRALGADPSKRDSRSWIEIING